MRRIAFVAACLVMSAPALAESIGEKTGVNSLIGVSPSTQDFVTEARRGDTFTVEASKLAAERGNEKTRSFAQKMVRNRQTMTNDLGNMITSGKVKAEVVPNLDSTRQKQLDKLQGLNGKEFNDQYVSDEVKAHKDSIDLFKRYAQGGDNADLKAWANSKVSELEENLQLAQKLD